MKKLVSLILVLAMLFSLSPLAFGAEDEAKKAADSLNKLGLFAGTGTNPDGTPIYNLEGIPTRSQAITMLVKLLGKETEAINGTWEIPFTDVANWAKPFVGYAYANGLTAGNSTTTFGGNDPVTATQYLTFVLKALGYEVGKDFQWNKAWEKSDELRITDGRYNENNTNFLRGDIAIISNNALDKSLKGKDMMLLTMIQENLAKAEMEKAEEEATISLYLAPINGKFFEGGIGIGGGTHPFEVRFNDTPVSDYTAVLENTSSAKLTSNGSNLIIEVIASGPNAVNITVKGQTARFYWEATGDRVNHSDVGIVLRDPYKELYLFPDQATGLLYGTFVFEVRVNGEPVSNYSAVLEKNDGCVATVTPGGRLELQVKKGSSNAVNITVNGKTARFFWEN